MRLPENKIKEAILHPNIAIRSRAARYFARPFCFDTSIMPLVIQAVETYGRDNQTFNLIGRARDLPQTESTIAWVLAELNDEACSKYENYSFNLSKVLVDADLDLIIPRESDILEARHFLGELGPSLTNRLRMLSWDEATCWQMLEEFCEANKDKQYTKEVDLTYANCIVEALARHGQRCEARVHEYLAVKLDDYRHHPMRWLEPLIVRLAGQIPLESTIPAIITKLLEDGGDLLNGECADALSRIGTPAVLHAVAEAFPTAPRCFRLYTNTPLENIHSDLAVDIGLRLLKQEKDEINQRELAYSLLSQFAYEGIEVTRQMLLGRELDFQEQGLRHYLLETCVLLGERFPEYDEWLATAKAEKEEHRRRVNELKGDPHGLMLFALEKLIGKEAKDLPKPKPPTPPTPPPPLMKLPRKPATKQKVGRNDPCPCGSGKKFKKCCMR